MSRRNTTSTSAEAASRPAASTPRQKSAHHAEQSADESFAQRTAKPRKKDATLGAEASSAHLAWRRIDLHIHTPASHDYEEPNRSYLDILKQAERRGLDVIAFTDHNTVNGYRAMLDEIARLEYLETLGRIRADEQARLNEYRRLRQKILVLPGFEFTATFGFHVLGIFPPDKPLRDIEHILIDLGVPGAALDGGLTEAGATSDVLKAYAAIDAAGGIAIAAHANSTNGVAMRGLNLGGQTRIAFTQDPHLHALEFTDLDRGRSASARLFDGSKPEYPRRMFIVQGSDAHRIVGSSDHPRRLGVGERATEVQLETVSFAALRALFLSQAFERVRPAFDVLDLPEDPIATLMQAGPGPKLALYTALPKRGDRLQDVLRDVCALANGEGGDVLITQPVKAGRKSGGREEVSSLARQLAAAIETQITPRLNSTVHVRTMLDGAPCLHIHVPQGEDVPYALDGGQFFVRQGEVSRPATRDEIVALARRGYQKAQQANPPSPRPSQRPAPTTNQAKRQPQPRPTSSQQHKPASSGPAPKAPSPPQAARPAQAPLKRGEEKPTVLITAPAASAANGAATLPGMPRTGVQVLAMEERNGNMHFTVRDLRNNTIIRNVTMKSARDLWHYAITQFAEHPYGPEDVAWRGDRAVLASEERAGKRRYDLAIRDANGQTHVFYGVTTDGLDETWQALIAEFEAQRTPPGAPATD
jgi:hypothetical protein